MDEELTMETGRGDTEPVQQTEPAPGQGGEPERVGEKALREEDVALFLEHYGHVDVDSIPAQVWEQVERGISLTGAYALYENARLKAQLAAREQKEDGRRRTPGSLGDSLPEPDEFDRLWEE